MHYMLLMYGDPTEAPAHDTPEGQAEFAGWMSYTQAMREAGVLGASEALQPTTTATTVSGATGETLTLDGPFAETKEVLGGFYVVDVPDLDAALEWAAKAPHLHHGKVEVRPVVSFRVSAAAALERAVREDGPGVLATLTRHLGGDLALAEDALQDAYLSALTAWERELPAVPAAWLTTAARRKALDRLRRARGLDDRVRTLEALAGRTGAAASPAADEGLLVDPSSLTDDRLRLLFTCCHPALALPARVALTVKSLGGLSTRETAAAFLVSETTMQQRLLRARSKIDAAGIPYRIPPDELLPERVGGVLTTLYVIFTEGHTASAGAALGRPDLALEALRLARLTRTLLPDEAEAQGLLALMLLTEARRPARTDAAGAAVGLAEQDRTLWDGEAVEEGLAVLDAAFALRRVGPFQLQAAVAALHARAPSFEGTDWVQIAALYDELQRRAPSPVVAINRAVAVGFAEGPAAGLALLEQVRELEAYVPLHAARADLRRRAGDAAGADAAYAAAIAASANVTQREELERRRASACARSGRTAPPRL